jgi:hypothetical protein
MKIKVRLSSKVNLYLSVDDWRFLITMQEARDIADGKRHIIDDCGKTLRADFSGLVLMENPHCFSRDTGSVCFRKVPMNSGYFFKRLVDLVDRGVLRDGATMKFDPASFRYRPTFASDMGFAQILKHERFTALNKIREAIRIAPKDELLRLRRLIAQKLDAGFTVMPDFADASFFFSGSYVGGIIFHRSSMKYSVHT